MNISTIFEAARRRVVALLAVFLLAAGGAVAGWFSAATVYDATTVGLVVPAGVDLDGRRLNPLDRVGFATTQLATMSTVVATSPTMVARVANETGAEVLTATNTTQERTSAPAPGIQITVTTRAESPEAASAGGAASVKAMNDELLRVQEDIGVPTDQRAAIITLIEPQASASSSRSAMRAAGGLFVGILGLGTIAVLLADALLMRRRDERGSHDARPSSATRTRESHESAQSDSDDTTWRRGAHTSPPDGAS
ncbi:MAG: hypothetical protein Q4G43_04590 [Mobilicoccus sp.]|nr:hypothetical protein [Mobilicoccus sp.]